MLERLAALEADQAQSQELSLLRALLTDHFGLASPSAGPRAATVPSAAPVLTAVGQTAADVMATDADPAPAPAVPTDSMSVHSSPSSSERTASPTRRAGKAGKHPLPRKQDLQDSPERATKDTPTKATKPKKSKGHQARWPKA